jgi:hypothetical protein
MSKLTEEPLAVNDRIMTLRLPLTHGRYCTILAIYAPTMTNSPENIDGFYVKLNQVLKDIPYADKIIVLGDFNARVGQDCVTWKGVLGGFGTGRVNANGERLLNLCNEHQLVITNSCFKHKQSHKNSWMHPRSQHWHLIDYIICRQRDLKDFCDTRAMRGANCNTDHIMIKSVTNLTVRKKRKKSRRLNKKLNVRKLKSKVVTKKLESAMNEKLKDLHIQPGTVEDRWDTFKTIVYEISNKALGLVGKQHEDWFEEKCRGFFNCLKIGILRELLF